ncbi:hypothetical protein [Bradyrhizobium mercantei]|uniref:hypothetical protein n=1 Tax=Bradyrhizobium mercantei TaxID=1904807 RepID=UPI0011773C67|nr:hypothetical protein [Bradyrhizobium mercantei]
MSEAICGTSLATCVLAPDVASLIRATLAFAINCTRDHQYIHQGDDGLHQQVMCNQRVTIVTTIASTMVSTITSMVTKATIA